VPPNPLFREENLTFGAFGICFCYVTSPHFMKEFGVQTRPVVIGQLAFLIALAAPLSSQGAMAPRRVVPANRSLAAIQIGVVPSASQLSDHLSVPIVSRSGMWR
jgi:hypothetical protein